MPSYLHAKYAEKIEYIITISERRKRENIGRVNEPLKKPILVVIENISILSWFLVFICFIWLNSKRFNVAHKVH